MVKPAQEAFRAQLPPKAATDAVQLDWNLRQWRDIEGALRRLQVRIDEIESAPPPGGTWDDGP